MHKYLVVFAILISTSTYSLLNAQYFQQEIFYEIEANLDTSKHTLQTTCNITYTNNSKNALDTIYLHLWANAFSDKLSAFSNQALRMGNLEFYFAGEKEMGGYNDLQVNVEDKKMTIYSWKNNTDVVYFLLPKSLQPGESVLMSTNYLLKLPKKISRMGYTRTDNYLMYWYPTPAVYDSEGWHPMPYLSMGETYSEVADFIINFTSPVESMLSSTPTRSQPLDIRKQYIGRGIIDYAFVTSTNKKVYQHSLTTQKGNKININFMSKYPERDSSALFYLERAINYFEPVIGTFPYSSLSILDKGKKSTSGMEYPGLITISGRDNEEGNFEYYLVHELLHQWFYSDLAFNQRDHAWLDEGLTTYFQQRYYKDTKELDHYSKKGAMFMHKGQQPLLQTVARAQACRHFHAPIETNATQIDPANYGFNAYEIPARMFAHLADFIGQRNFDNGIHEFYESWKGKHPGPGDLQKTLEQVSSKDLSWFFEDLIKGDWAYDYGIKKIKNGKLEIEHKSGSSPPYKVTFKSKDGSESKEVWVDGHKGIQSIPLPDERLHVAIIDDQGLSMDINTNNNSINRKRPVKLIPGLKLDDGRYRELYFLPTISYNSSDGGQLGMAFYNSTLPGKKLKWAISPAFGFGSSSPVGEGWLSYDHYLNAKKFRKLQFKLNAKSYSYRYSETLDQNLRFTRISPHISLHFSHALEDQKYSKLYFKPIFVNEEIFVFNEETVSIDSRRSTLFRLGFEHYNFWNLGPSDVIAQLEFQPYTNDVGEKHHYLKMNASYSKSFFYAPNRSVDFRLWASYFIINSQRATANYDPSFVRGSSALIHQGFNDYAYDGYFFNRANQNVSLDNQIGYQGGGFKTPFGSQYTIGQTNDFAFALNLKSNLPIKTPRLFPLKLFMDVGYYRAKDTAEASLEGRSFYSGGVMLEYGGGLFSIYLPLINSQAISDIYDTEGIGLLGRVSFRLDLIRFNPWDIAEDFNL